MNTTVPHIGLLGLSCYGLSSFTLNEIGGGETNMLQNIFFGGIGVVGIILGLYIILSYRKKETFNIFLGVFTFTTALILLELVLFWWDAIAYNPRVPFYKSLIFLWGPSLHLYLKRKAESASGETSKTPVLKHYAFFVLSLVFLSIIGNIKMDSATSEYSLSWFVIGFLTNNWVKAIYSACYITLMVDAYMGYRMGMDHMSKRWAQSLIAFFSLLLFIIVFRAEFNNLHTFDFLSKYLAAYCFSIFILILGFLNILFPISKLGQSPMNPISIEEKYKNSGLTPDMLKLLKEQVTQAMEEDKLFLDHKLTLQTFAETLNTDRYSLSQVINQEFDKNFYEFLNDYRINESVKLIKDNPERRQFVLDLIYESGFNNKVSFYKAFKKRKHMTPAKFIKTFSATL